MEVISVHSSKLKSLLRKRLGNGRTKSQVWPPGLSQQMMGKRLYEQKEVCPNAIMVEASSSYPSDFLSTMVTPTYVNFMHILYTAGLNISEERQIGNCTVYK